MDFKSRDDEGRAPLHARDVQRTDRTAEQDRSRTPAQRFNAEQSDEDDLLPRRVLGEELLDRDARDRVEAMDRPPAPTESDVYNLGEEARRADPYDEDLTGIPPLEEEPENRDIMPDQIQTEAPNAVGDDDVELTARSRRDLRPIPPDQLPEG